MSVRDALCILLYVHGEPTLVGLTEFIVGLEGQAACGFLKASLSPLFSFSRLKSPIPPGLSSVLRIRAQHRLRKLTFIFIFLSYISSPLSFWEGSLKDYFADVVLSPDSSK